MNLFGCVRRFSGITEEKLRHVTKRLEQVREELFKFIFKDSILIGHSLENDLRALKVGYAFVSTRCYMVRVLGII